MKVIILAPIALEATPELLLALQSALKVKVEMNDKKGDIRVYYESVLKQPQFILTDQIHWQAPSGNSTDC